MKVFALILTLSLPLAGNAVAQSTQLKPGLWEHSMQMKDGSGQMAAAMAQMQTQMANMPAEQRKMFEKMMADNGVVMGSKGTTVKVCMTKEDVERDQLPEQEGCTQNIKRGASTWTVSFQCKGDPPTSGEGVVRLLSSTAYQGDFTVNTAVNGKPERMQMTQAGKWLGADCGQLRSKK